ncbi:superinfection immunity protein [uncultured Helicobacter sp.]|uniref:superinfection immunity protein n=1 Tax=Helicobacter sp. TaxID=218 RepID=UPI0026298751|nr:superinfection immunity protein [uncultured Helicobacter sp.]
MFEQEKITIIDGVEIVSSGIDYLSMGVFVLICVASFCVYFLPSFIALMRHHSDKVLIIVVNVFFGWSVLGWILALGWSLLRR